VRRPPIIVVFLAVFMLALGETAGAAMSQLRPALQRYAIARVVANAPAHGLSGSAEYDEEVIGRAVFTAEAGLSFLHTHAQSLPVVTLLASTLVATVVPWRRARSALHLLLGVGTLFPLGYLVYGLAVLEAGRDAGMALAEGWILTPLGSAVILGLVGLAAVLLRRRAPAA
jgi:hypothetical protein